MGLVDTPICCPQTKRHHICEGIGVIAVLPPSVENLRGVCITILPLLLYAMNEIRVYSSFFKLQQVKPNLAKIIIPLSVRIRKVLWSFAGQPIHWRVIHRNYGRQSTDHHPEVFEPHVQPEDLEWRQAEELLYHIEPALKFWEG